ncbi:MAG: hypothetical protein AAF267_08370 [Deinococcota bacterium]
MKYVLVLLLLITGSSFAQVSVSAPVQDVLEDFTTISQRTSHLTLEKHVSKG